jgi:hypothetical protein
MNYVNELEWSHELTGESSELEFAKYAGKIWDIAKRLHNAPAVTKLKNDFIDAAKAFGKQLIPVITGTTGTTGSSGKPGGIPGTGIPSNAARQVIFYRKVIRNAANYLNKALLSGYQGHSPAIVKHAFNRASKSVAQNTPGVVTAPQFAPTPPAPGPYRSTTRGMRGTSYIPGPAPAVTGPGSLPYGGKTVSLGGDGRTCTTSLQKHGRWIKRGNTLIILEGLSKKNTACS